MTGPQPGKPYRQKRYHNYAEDVPAPVYIIKDEAFNPATGERIVIYHDLGASTGLRLWLPEIEFLTLFEEEPT